MATLNAWFVQQIGDWDHTSIPWSLSLQHNATMPLSAFLEHVFVSNPTNVSRGDTQNWFQQRREAVTLVLFLLSLPNRDNTKKRIWRQEGRQHT